MWAVDDIGQNACHYAAYGGNVNIMEKVLAIDGSGLNFKSTSGMTPLHCAARFCRKSMVESLLDAGVNVDAVNHNGETPDQIDGVTDEIKYLISEHRRK